MLEWTTEFLSGTHRPRLIFAQETYPAWLLFVEESGYQVIEGVERGWNVRSALIVDQGVEVHGLTDADLPELRYHGTYVAAGLWTRSDDTKAVLASVHASPAYAEPEKYDWPDSASLPTRRHGGSDPRWPNDRWWDSDFVLATLHELGERFQVPMLVAGDLNESLLDDPEGGTWGSEYFKNAAALGLDAWLHKLWCREHKGEMPTREGLQLDHILVARGGEELLRVEPAPERDTRWASDHSARRLSDHAAIWFALAD